MIKVLMAWIMVTIVFAVHSEEDSVVQQKKFEAQKRLFMEEEKAERGAMKGTVPQLIEKIKTTKDGQREFIIQNLAQSKDPRAIGPLSEIMLSSTVPGERSYAASKLSNFHDKQTTPAFKKALLDTSGAMSNAAMALYSLGEIDAALPELEKLVLKGRTGVLNCFKHFDERGKAVFDSNARPIYIKAINSKNEDLRIVAAIYLAEMGEKDVAFQVSMDVLRNSISQRNRETAVGSLEAIGSDKAVVEISKLQGDPKLHNVVIRTLKAMKRNDLIKK